MDSFFKSIRVFLTPLVIILVSCNDTTEVKKVISNPTQKPKVNSARLPKVGIQIQGNFNGNDTTIVAGAFLRKAGTGNPVEEGSANRYEIRFSDYNIKAIDAGCCEIRLVNEGDLTNDGVDEISIYQAPMNGCTYVMSTYSFKNSVWVQVVKPFLIPTGCDRVTDADLQRRIFKENGNIYYLENDMSDEADKLVKTKAPQN